MLVSQRCRSCARQASKLSSTSILQASRCRIGHVGDFEIGRVASFLQRGMRRRKCVGYFPVASAKTSVTPQTTAASGRW
jgi:hypothetical protein